MYMQKRALFASGLFLTATNFLLRGISILFNAHLTLRMGEVAMGRLQMVLSVYALASAVAGSGLSVAVCRAVSEAAPENTGRITKVGFALSAGMGGAACALLCALAKPIAISWLGDASAAQLLRLLSPSLVLCALSGCVSGCLIARGKSWLHALLGAGAQVLEIALCLVSLADGQGLSGQQMCRRVVLCSVVSQGICLCAGLFCLPRGSRGDMTKKEAFVQIARLALPITANACVRNGFRTAENTLIPPLLAGYGLGRDAALSGFGIFKSMAMPLIHLPGTVVGSFSTVLLPVLAQRRRKGSMAAGVERVLFWVLCYALFIMGIFFFGGHELAALVYDSRELGSLLSALCLLAPFCYVDIATDTMLSALDQQNFALRLNSVDSLLRLGLMCLFVPRWGFDGYVAVLLFSGLFNVSFSLRRLYTAAQLHLRPAFFFRPLFCALAAFALGCLLPKGDGFFAFLGWVCVQLAVYGIFLLVTRQRNWYTVVSSSEGL